MKIEKINKVERISPIKNDIKNGIREDKSFREAIKEAAKRKDVNRKYKSNTFMQENKNDKKEEREI